MDWCTLTLGAVISLLITGGAVALTLCLQTPKVKPSIVKDRDSVVCRVQNLPHTCIVLRKIHLERNAVEELTASIDIAEGEIGRPNSYFIPGIIWDSGPRDIWLDNGTMGKSVRLSPSSRLGATIKLLAVLKDSVKAFSEDADILKDLPQNRYILHIQICADGKIIDVYRNFTVNSEVPLFEWRGEQWQSEK